MSELRQYGEVLPHMPDEIKFQDLRQTKFSLCYCEYSSPNAIKRLCFLCLLISVRQYSITKGIVSSLHPQYRRLLKNNAVVLSYIFFYVYTSSFLSVRLVFTTPTIEKSAPRGLFFWGRYKIALFELELFALKFWT